MSSQPRFSNRVNTIAVSATKAMAEKAARIGGCVSLGQGVPSFATPAEVIDRLTEALTTNPACGKYTLQTGLLELRQCLRMTVDILNLSQINTRQRQQTMAHWQSKSRYQLDTRGCSQ